MPAVTAAAAASGFLETLRVPTGPLAGKPVRLGAFQRRYIGGALAPETSVAALSLARGGGKSTLVSGLALGSLLGKFDPQPSREILVGARTRDQGAIVWTYVAGLARSLPPSVQKRLTWRRAPRLEIEYADKTGPHIIRVLASDGKNALGSSPTMAIADERGHWSRDQGDELEQAMLSGLGKRGGKLLMISTSAPDDSHPFSKWLDEEQSGVYRQEHRPTPGLPADDRDSLLIANPGAVEGIGAGIEWLEAQALRAIARGGSSLTSFRLFNRNERISGETRDLLLTTDEWLKCEIESLPPREGSCVIGIDLGGSASMSAAAFYWPATGRLECSAWFPGKPGLLDRGQADGVGNRYVEMANRGELFVLGDATVPVTAWLGEVMRHVDGEHVAAIIMDRYKQSELGEAIDRAGIRCPIIWRGFGFRDGGEDCERFRRAVFDEKVKAKPSLLLRSAFADAVCLRDPANNMKLAKARSNGRIDAASASVIAIAEGMRISGRPVRKARAPVWV